MGSDQLLENRQALTVFAISAETLMGARITNSRTSAQPRDGMVEVVLTTLGRDAAGEPVPVGEVKRWSIGGVLQKDAAGAPATAAALPVTFGKGTHRVMVEGSDAQGRPISAQADVEVGIQVTEKTDVKVRPRP